jgi:oligoendopeptidase F
MQTNPVFNASSYNENSLNKGVRNKEFNRIMVDNEAMLKRLQQRQSHYNVLSWEQERKNQVKMVKQLCHYKPSITRRKKVFRKKTTGEDRLDMERRYASAGPNK